MTAVSNQRGVLGGWGGFHWVPDGTGRMLICYTGPFIYCKSPACVIMNEWRCHRNV